MLIHVMHASVLERICVCVCMCVFLCKKIRTRACVYYLYHGVLPVSCHLHCNDTRVVEDPS
jgi:hypothetical protein